MWHVAATRPQVSQSMIVADSGKGTILAEAEDSATKRRRHRYKAHMTLGSNRVVSNEIEFKRTVCGQLACFRYP